MNRLAIFFATCVLLSSAVVNADEVTYEIHAVVDQVLDPGKVLIGHVKKGDEILGTYTFNDNVQDADLSPNYGHFNQVNDKGSGFDLVVNALKINHRKVVESLSHSISTGDGKTDFYYIENRSVSRLGRKFVIDEIDLAIFDKTGKALKSDELSREPPAIYDAEDKNILISGRHIQSRNQFDFKARLISFRKIARKESEE